MSASVGCIVVLGRQGSGKGVQSARLAERLGYEHVSTGALLRHAVEEETPLGRAVEAQVAAGSLVSDDLVTGLVAERLAIARQEGHGLVLDGYPRTVEQAERLEELVGPAGIEAAVQIEVPRAIAVDRILRRRVCRLCGAPGEATTCDRCGGPTTRRADDSGAAIGRRMSEHAATVAPLLEWFASRGLLRYVDGVGHPDLVAARISAALALRPLANA